MRAQFLLVLLLPLLLEIATVGGSWFPLLPRIPDEKWDEIFRRYDIINTHTRCTEISSQAKHSNRFFPLYKQAPATIVLVGTGHGKGMLEAKFKDSTYIFEAEIAFSDEHPCVILPPYQPIEWLMVSLPQFSVSVCSYEGSVVGENRGGAGSTDCACSRILSNGPKCKTIAFPRTIRKPEMEFFLTAETTPSVDDVTVCTILTVDRLLRLSQMSHFWGGPISAAVYLHELSEVEQVMEWWLSTPSMRLHVDVHLVLDDKIAAFQLPDRAFPVNILRNVGIRFARTANVFYIEGDFIPSPDLYPNLEEVKQRLARGERSVFIVAPFSTDKADYDMSHFPKNKQELSTEVRKPNALIRDLTYYSSHRAFNFENWFSSESIYRQSFSHGYEPYYVGPKSFPLFEEIYIGCGQDKIAHPNELNAAGFEFFVLPHGFIMHIDSSGMGTSWCRGMGGRAALKSNALSLRLEHAYSQNAETELSYDSRAHWWDLAPVIGTAQFAHHRLQCVPADIQNGKPPSGARDCPVCEKCRCDICPEVNGDQQCEKYSEAQALQLQFDLATQELSVSETKVQTLTKGTELLQMQNQGLHQKAALLSNVCLLLMSVLFIVVARTLYLMLRGSSAGLGFLPMWKKEKASVYNE